LVMHNSTLPAKQRDVGTLPLQYAWRLGCLYQSTKEKLSDPVSITISDKRVPVIVGDRKLARWRGIRVPSPHQPSVPPTTPDCQSTKTLSRTAIPAQAPPPLPRFPPCPRRGPHGGGATQRRDGPSRPLIRSATSALQRV
jgi:hypothetical protein